MEIMLITIWIGIICKDIDCNDNLKEYYDWKQHRIGAMKIDWIAICQINFYLKYNSYWMTFFTWPNHSLSNQFFTENTIYRITYLYRIQAF